MLSRWREFSSRHADVRLKPLPGSALCVLCVLCGAQQMSLVRAGLLFFASAAILFVLVRLLEPRLAFFPFPRRDDDPS